ncbi:expressed unknown protein [Seminavis robusta]|uniref:Uncharacterized protein n=1 Tax=Seminavis robusta TaxID=568900 RepID=A0A9N8F487_9STRA|nr:expressed unknown protein [Seminavis robusta]|eukprot:Sro3605_g349620.1 n/a (948) ;mRNA; r:2401-5244
MKYSLLSSSSSLKVESPTSMCKVKRRSRKSDQNKYDSIFKWEDYAGLMVQQDLDAKDSKHSTIEDGSGIYDWEKHRRRHSANDSAKEQGKERRRRSRRSTKSSGLPPTSNSSDSGTTTADSRGKTVRRCSTRGRVEANLRHTQSMDESSKSSTSAGSSKTLRRVKSTDSATVKRADGDAHSRRQDSTKEGNTDDNKASRPRRRSRSLGSSIQGRGSNDTRQTRRSRRSSQDSCCSLDEAKSYGDKASSPRRRSRSVGSSILRTESNNAPQSRRSRHSSQDSCCSSDEAKRGSDKASSSHRRSRSLGCSIHSRGSSSIHSRGSSSAPRTRRSRRSSQDVPSEHITNEAKTDDEKASNSRRRSRSLGCSILRRGSNNAPPSRRSRSSKRIFSSEDTTKEARTDDNRASRPQRRSRSLGCSIQGRGSNDTPRTRRCRRSSQDNSSSDEAKTGRGKPSSPRRRSRSLGSSILGKDSTNAPRSRRSGRSSQDSSSSDEAKSDSGKASRPIRRSRSLGCSIHSRGSSKAPRTRRSYHSSNDSSSSVGSSILSTESSNAPRTRRSRRPLQDTSSSDEAKKDSNKASSPRRRSRSVGSSILRTESNNTPRSRRSGRSSHVAPDDKGEQASVNEQILSLTSLFSEQQGKTEGNIEKPIDAAATNLHEDVLASMEHRSNLSRTFLANQRSSSWRSLFDDQAKDSSSCWSKRGSIEILDFGPSIHDILDSGPSLHESYHGSGSSFVVPRVKTTTVTRGKTLHSSFHGFDRAFNAFHDECKDSKQTVAAKAEDQAAGPEDSTEAPEDAGLHDDDKLASLERRSKRRSKPTRSFDNGLSRSFRSLFHDQDHETGRDDLVKRFHESCASLPSSSLDSQSQQSKRFSTSVFDSESSLHESSRNSGSSQNSGSSVVVAPMVKPNTRSSLPSKTLHSYLYGSIGAFNESKGLAELDEFACLGSS